MNATIDGNASEARLYTSMHEFSPLHIAVNLNSLEMASLLIGQGANVNQTTDDDRSPLHIAVGKGNMQLAAILVAHGADVNARDFEDYTPIYSAACYGRLGTVELLVTNGADITASGSDGRTAYACATSKNHQDIIAFLQNLGIVE